MVISNEEYLDSTAYGLVTLFSLTSRDTVRIIVSSFKVWKLKECENYKFAGLVAVARQIRGHWRGGSDLKMGIYIESVYG